MARDTKRSADNEVLQRAKCYADQYRVIIEPLGSGDGFLARCIELPLVVADGKTVDECFAQVRYQLMHAVAALIRMNQEPPKPARPNEQVLDQQVNVRMTSEEKLLTEMKARQLGFRGISDFVRSLILRALRD